MEKHPAMLEGVNNAMTRSPDWDYGYATELSRITGGPL